MNWQLVVKMTECQYIFAGFIFYFKKILHNNKLNPNHIQWYPARNHKNNLTFSFIRQKNDANVDDGGFTTVMWNLVVVETRYKGLKDL